MDPQKLKMLTFAVAGAAALTVATDAAACETCEYDPNSEGYICWSGMLGYGSGSCWGGGEEYCELEGQCGGEQNECEWWEYCDEWGDYQCWGWGNCES